MGIESVAVKDFKINYLRFGDASKPKVVLIETYKVGELKNADSLDDIDGEVYYTTGISDSQDKKDYLKDAGGLSAARVDS